MIKDTRQSIQDRREEVLAAALEEFAVHGLHGGSSDSIAKSVGISQPYIFKIFGTKKDLFIAAVNRVCDRIMTAFQSAAEGTPASPEALEAIGCAYESLTRLEFMVLLQGFAACEDAEVRAAVGARWQEITNFLVKASGTSGDPIDAFLAHGLLLTIESAAGLTAHRTAGS